MTDRALQSNERGVSTIELALILPIMFVLFFATIGINWTICQQYIIQRGHFAAARAASLLPSNCKNGAADEMEDQMNSYRIPFNRATDIVRSGPVVIDGIPGFHMALSINLQCISCGLPGMQSFARYSGDVFYPFMANSSCYFESDS